VYNFYSFSKKWQCACPYLCSHSICLITWAAVLQPFLDLEKQGQGVNEKVWRGQGSANLSPGQPVMKIAVKPDRLLPAGGGAGLYREGLSASTIIDWRARCCGTAFPLL